MKTQNLTIALPEELDNELERAATKIYCSKGAIVKMALARFLKEGKNEKPNAPADNP